VSPMHLVGRGVGRGSWRASPSASSWRLGTEPGCVVRLRGTRRRAACRGDQVGFAGAVPARATQLCGRSIASCVLAIEADTAIYSGNSGSSVWTRTLSSPGIRAVPDSLSTRSCGWEAGRNRGGLPWACRTCSPRNVRSWANRIGFRGCGHPKGNATEVRPPTHQAQLVSGCDRAAILARMGEARLWREGADGSRGVATNKTPRGTGGRRRAAAGCAPGLSATPSARVMLPRGLQLAAGEAPGFECPLTMGVGLARNGPQPSRAQATPRSRGWARLLLRSRWRSALRACRPGRASRSRRLAMIAHTALPLPSRQPCTRSKLASGGTVRVRLNRHSGIRTTSQRWTRRQDAFDEQTESAAGLAADGLESIGALRGLFGYRALRLMWFDGAEVWQ
jgi:hypothetical protein